MATEPCAEEVLGALTQAALTSEGVGWAVFDLTGRLCSTAGLCTELLAPGVMALRNPDVQRLLSLAIDDGVVFRGMVTFGMDRASLRSKLGAVVRQGSTLLLFIEPTRLGKDDTIHALAELVRSSSVRQRELIKRNLLAERRGRLMAEAREEAVRESQLDPLTGLGSRAFGLTRLGVEIDVAERQGGTLWVLLLDLDHFKAVNDSWGHGVGDRVLARVGDTIRMGAEPFEFAARIGGEELLVVLPGASPTAAWARAEGLRAAVALLRDEGLPQVTLSAGLARLRFGEGSLSLLARADGALYAAKEAGRDRVVVAGGDAQEVPEP